MATFATSGVTASWTSSTNAGFYRGTTITVKYSSYTSTGPKYIYASSSASGGYAYKGTLSSTSNHTISVAADTSTISLSRTVYIIITDEYTTSTYRPDGRDSYCHEVIVPRFVASFYKGSSTKYTYNSADHEDLESKLAKSGYDILGCTYSSSISSACEQYPNWISYGIDLDGGTWYTVYWIEGYDYGSVNFTYYLGSGSPQTKTTNVIKTNKYLYGTGRTTGGGISSDFDDMNFTCKSNSSYGFCGFTTDISAYDSGSFYADPAVAYDDTGTTTVYGVFMKEATTKNVNLNYYIGTVDTQTVTKTTTTGDSYYYGKGSHIAGDEEITYGNITTDCPVSGWTFVGFTANESTQSSTSKAEALFNAGNTVIYGTYKKTETMTFYPENGGLSDTSPITNFRYGKGIVTNNIPEEPVLTYDGYTLIGWATASGGTPLSWNEQWNNNTQTVYAIWERNGNVYFGVGDNWILVELYIGAKVNDVLQWIPIKMKYGNDGSWK